MSAGDRHALLEAHQFGEHFGAADDRQALCARRGEFGIVALDGGRDDDDGGLAEVGRIMADEDAGALVAQPFDVGVVAGVRALHPIALIEQHFGDARHADAADADKMDGAKFARQLHKRRLRTAEASRRACSAAARPARHNAICRFGQIGRGWPAPQSRRDGPAQEPSLSST